MPWIPEIFGVCLSLCISDVFCICYNPWTRGGESGLVAGLDFKSSGIHRKVGSVGSIPMHLRHNDLQRLPTVAFRSPDLWENSHCSDFGQISNRT